MNGDVQVFKDLGYTAEDVRHVSVYVRPSIKEDNGQLVQSHKAFVGEANGNFTADFPTKFIFVSVTPGWVFETFDLAGQTWPGMAIIPADGDFQISYGDPAQRSIIVQDDCKCFFTYRYQLVLKNVNTGELVVVDPDVENKDRPPGGS